MAAEKVRRFHYAGRTVYGNVTLTHGAHGGRDYVRGGRKTLRRVEVPGRGHRAVAGPTKRAQRRRNGSGRCRAEELGLSSRGGRGSGYGQRARPTQRLAVLRAPGRLDVVVAC